MPYIGQRPSKGDENNFKILDDISSYTLTFDGSDSSVVSAANDTITSLTHRFVQGQRVTYNNGGGSNIAGLTSGTVYYVIKHDHHNIKLATSASNAANGTAVNITNVGSGASHTINVAFDGVNTKFKATHTNGQKAKITRSAQLVISINGVIQQPHDTATPSTGFGFDLDGTIVFSQAPVSTDEYWAHVLTNNNVTFDISDNDIDNFTGDGSTTEFNLSKSPPDNRNVLVTIDGVVQYPNDPDGTARAYVVVENVLTFNSAPDSGVEIQVRHIGFAGSTSGSGGVTNFYGRTGSVVLKDTDNISVNDAAVTGDLTVTGNMTVNGDFTTLNTTLREVELLKVDANSNTTAGIITQRGTGDILNLFDNNSEVLTVTDGGQVGINSTSPSIGAILDIGVPTTKTGGLDATVSIASTDNKTYPNVGSFSVTLGLKQEIEVGGTQTLNPSSPGGYNFITGITNFMRKKNDNVQDVERSYYAGINQNFFWNDENTLKQYTGITDSLTYFGKDANGRTTNYLIANQISVNAGAGKTQTINRIYGEELRFQNFAGDGSTPTTNVTHWSGFRPALYWFLVNSNYTGTITDAVFYDTSHSWGVTVAGSGSATHTISNLYGLRLRPPGSSAGLTITNNYGVYQEWSSAKNYFAGKVGIGTNNPAATVDIQAVSSTNPVLNLGGGGSDNGDLTVNSGESLQVGHFNRSTSSFEERLRITPDGKLGINTTSPQDNAKVQNYTSTTRHQSFQSTNGDLAIVSDNNSNPVAYIKGTGTADLLNVFDNTTEVFTIKDGGNIGINSTAPRGKLDIKFAGAPNFITFGSDADNPKMEWFRHTGGSPSHYATEIQMVLGDLVISTAAIANLGSHSYSEKLRIQGSTGDVGIGSAIPSAKLDIAGGLSIKDSTAQYKFEVSTNSNEAEIKSRLNTGAYRNTVFLTNNFVVKNTGANSPVESFRIKHNGYVGIGTDNPTHLLHIHNNGAVGSAENDRKYNGRFTTRTPNNLNLDIYDRRWEDTQTHGWIGTEKRIEYNVDGNTNKRMWMSFFNPDNSTGNNVIRFGEQEDTEWMRIKDGKLLVGAAAIQYASSPLYVSGTDPVIGELHHSDGGTNDEARLMLGALANNPPSNRGAGIAAVNNGAGHDLIIKCSSSHGLSPTEKLRIHSSGLVEANSSFGNTYSSTTGITPHIRVRNQQGADNIYGGIQLRADRNNGAASVFNIACLNSSLDYASTLVFQSRNTDSNFSEKLRIEAGGGVKFTGKGTSIPVGGILHHTNNNLYVRGGTNGCIVSNQDNTTTVQIYNGYIKFETNDGTEKLRITSAGKVGIGTDNPTAHLQVYRKTSFASNPIIQARSNNGSTNELKFEIDGDGDAYFNGNIGVGIQNPVARLHVHNSGTSAADHAYAFFTTGDTGSTASDGLTVGVAANQVASVNYREAGTLTLNTSATPRVTITSDGKVGINVTPSQMFEVVTDFGLDDNLYKVNTSYRSGNNASGYTASGLQITSSADNNNGEKHTAFIQFSNRDPALNGSHGASAFITMSTPSGTGTYGTGQFDFYCRNGAPYAFPNDPQAASSYWMSSLFTIKSNGNVGVNDTSPPARFVVNNGTNNAQFVQMKNEEVGLFFGAYGTGTTYPREATINGSRIDGGSLPFLRIAGQGGIKFCVDLNTPRAQINSSGHFLVGNSTTQFTTSAIPVVFGSGSGTNGITIYAGSSSTSFVHFADGTSGAQRYAGSVGYNHNDDQLNLSVNDTPRVRIHDSNFREIIFPQQHENTYAQRVYRTTVSANAQTFVKFATVSGPSYGTHIKMSTTSTIGNVVTTGDFEIKVGHSQDILIISKTLAYTNLTVKVVSNNNQNFDLYIKRSGGAAQSSNSTHKIAIHPQLEDTVVFNSTINYSGNSHEHTTSTGAWKITGTGGPDGHIIANGNIYGNTKNFSIPHPLSSLTSTKKLVHASIEGPQLDLIYRGKANLVDGTATVNIDTVSGMSDGTFVALNRDVQCFTTNETGWTNVKGSVSGNVLTIIAQDNSCTDTISWMVVGERQDDNAKLSNTTDDSGNLIVEPSIIENYDSSHLHESYPTS